jgi:hypothetical protein
MFFILKNHTFPPEISHMEGIKIFYGISGMLFAVFWLSICTKELSSDSLSDSVLSITTGTTQFALELLQVSNIMLSLN